MNYHKKFLNYFLGKKTPKAAADDFDARKSIFSKIFDEEMIFRTISATLL